MNNLKTACFDSPVGKIYLLADDHYLYRLSFNIIDDSFGRNPIIDISILQLIEYFEGKRQYFDIPIKIKGSIFQQRIWNALKTIEYGKTISYEGLAILSKHNTAIRAAANACGKNQIPIIIPCHRVIRKNGSLGGFNSDINIKKRLLQLESQYTS